GRPHGHGPARLRRDHTHRPTWIARDLGNRTDGLPFAEPDSIVTTGGDPMRVLVKSALVAVALGVVGLVGVAALPANALPIKVSTNADIVCNEPSGIGGFKPPITTVSSGTGYAANTPVVV